MKSPQLFTLIFTIIGSGLILSNAGGPAANNTLATGAPGDGGNTCVTCHNNSGGFGNISIELEMTNESGNEVTEYKADSIYQIKITVNNPSGTPAGYGFQMICLDDENDDNYNGWSNPSSNAQLSTSASRNYVEHDGISSTNEFTVDWTAPESGTGDVTFYVGGNAVNGANGTGGDRAAIDDFTFEELLADTTPNGIADARIESFTIFPNPVLDKAQITGSVNGSLFEVYDSRGALVLQTRVMEKAIDLSSLESGFYLIYESSSKTSTKVFKL